MSIPPSIHTPRRGTRTRSTHRALNVVALKVLFTPLQSLCQLTFKLLLIVALITPLP